jgi:hypothetical protein
MSRAPMGPALLKFKVDNFQRRTDALDWRWHMSQEIFSNITVLNEYRPDANHDQNIQPIVEFAFHLDNSSDDIASENELAQRFPDMVWAYKTWSSQEARFDRFALEALLCSGATAEEIAEHLVTLPTCVVAYEKMFYDVRPYLDEASWMYSHVFRDPTTDGSAIEFEDIFWKLFGWKHMFGKAGALCLIHYAAPMADDVENCIRSLNRKQFGFHALVALFQLQPNRFNEQAVLEQYQKLIEIEEDTGSEVTEVKAQFNVLMSTLSESFHLASPQKQLAAVEARADEEFSQAFVIPEAETVDVFAQ